MTTDPITFNHILGQGRVNQLGGVFINGRPLPLHIREAIITMAKTGTKPCHISRQLKVSHGAVSKILNRYAETGSISPGQIGGSPRARITVQAYEKHILNAIGEYPHYSAAELRDHLIQKDICTKHNAPTTAAINRVIKSRVIPREKKMERKRLSYSIDSILGISIDDSSKSSSDDDDGTVSPSSNEASRRNRTSFTPEQLDALENAFKSNTYPDTVARTEISRETGLTEDKIMTWFSNRRARVRKHIHIPMYQQYSAAQNFSTTNTNTASYPSLMTPPMLFLPTYAATSQFPSPFCFQQFFNDKSPPSP